MRENRHAPPGGERSRRGGLRGSYALHLVLVAVIACEGLYYVATRTTKDVLAERLERGTPEERVHALFVLSNRGRPEMLDRESLERLLSDPDVALREWTMTSNYIRQGDVDLQEGYINALVSEPERTRCRFFLDHRVGVAEWMTIEDLERFLEAARDDR